MTDQIQTARRNLLLGLSGLALTCSLALGIQTMSAPTAVIAGEQAGQPLFPDFLNRKADIRSIRVLTRDTVYTLQYDESGWSMLEAGGYPVREDRISALASGLETLSWGDPRTRDTGKFDRIGLGSPADDGLGAQIDLYLSGGELFGQLISGRKANRLYGRLPDDDQAFTLQGDLPPLYSREAWLDLDVIDMQADAIASTVLMDATGATLRLQRPIGGTIRDFRPIGDLELQNQLVASAPALALARLSPIDVIAASALQTEPVYEHVTITFDGLEVTTKAYVELDGYYVTLRAVEAGLGASRAESINQKTDGWAFKLQPFDWNDFTVPVSDLVRP